MQVPVIRNLALTAAGNGAIAGKDVRRFWPDYDVFRFSKECVFLDENNTVVAADPAAWLTRLSQEFDGLWLHRVAAKRSIDDRMSVAFVGGGPRWIIEAVRDGGSELWEGGDALGDRRDPGGKIWDSGYVRIARDWKEPRRPPRPFPEIFTELDATLAKIAEFARDHDRANFERCFRDARTALKGRSARDPLFAFADFPREARQLWSAIGSAWVFGGMGSWNDVSYPGAEGELYDELSAALFEQLNEAVVAVANSTWPARTAQSRAGTTWWQRLIKGP